MLGLLSSVESSDLGDLTGDVEGDLDDVKIFVEGRLFFSEKESWRFDGDWDLPKSFGRTIDNYYD